MTSPQSLAGKVALITGGSQGIGAAVALHLSSLGARVVINYSSRSAPAEELVEKIGSDKAIAIKADAGNMQDIQRLVDETLAWGGGKIDILIANAALGALNTPLESTTEEMYDKVMQLNVKGPYFLVQVCIHTLRDHRWIACSLLETESSTPHALGLAHPARLLYPDCLLRHRTQLPLVRDVQGRH